MDLRHAGRTLQGLGVALMIVALTGALGTGAWAGAGFVTQFLPIPTPSPSGSPPTPAASGLPSATPTPKVYQVAKGGKLLMSVSGSLSFGSRQSSQTNYVGGVPASIFGPTPTATATPTLSPIQAVTSNQSQTSGTVGMLADFARRTSSTSLDLKFPFGFSTAGRASFGGFTLMYSTPKYALGYGPQIVSVLGQVPSGGTLRGAFGIVPAPGGDLTYMRGPTVGAGSEIIPLDAVRYRGLHGHEIYELALMRADGSSGLTGQSATSLFGVATTRGSLTAIGEISFQHRVGGDTSPTTPTYQVRIDDGGTNSYLTAIHRHLAGGFVIYGGGELNNDDYTDFGYHRNGTTNFSFDTSVDKLAFPGSSGSEGTTNTTRLISTSFGGPYRLGTYSLAGTSQRTASSTGATSWTGSANAQLSAEIGNGFLLLGTVLNRQTQSTLSPIGQVGYTAVFQRPFHNYSVGLTATEYRQFSTENGTSRSITEGFNIARQFHKTSIGFAQNFGKAISPLTDANLRNTQLYVTRQISPVISLQTTYQLQSLNDRLNPALSGKSSSFNVAINAPLSFGNGLVSGRKDPHLPATIIGRVLTDTSSNPYLSGLVSAGLNNVQVVLDDKIIQRTDLSGDFQFSFVSPGQHQLRIESASLPRGVTVDVPVYTLTVEGGQTAQVTFFVGNFGGVQGHVYGRDDTGAIVPLPNVLLRVDGGAYSTTDQTGAYGFGKLHPGKHTITVIENSVPAFAEFDPAKEKAEVEVRNGVFTDLDFRAEPLGSIAGTVVFDKDVNVRHDIVLGVENAYVVAEPGEHAAIVNDDGTFIIDNLPPGDYTVSVDPETIPEGLGAGPDSIAVTLGSQEHYQGAAFMVGHLHKKVVFSFTGGSGAAAAANLPKVRVSETRLPPRGTATITVDAPKSAGSVAAMAFNQVFNLQFSETRDAWVGELTVPTNAKAGPYQVEAKAATGTQPEAASVTVDAKMPVAIMQMEPPNPVKGSYVLVRARFLVDVKPGDRIDWEDGQVTTLGRPITGRVFTFNVRISLRPLHGLLLTGVGGLPISLL